MKVLYAAYRHDPLIPDIASGSDYYFYRAIRQSASDIRLLGPFLNRPIIIEEIFRRLYKSVTGKKYAKFPLSMAWHVSQALNRAEQIQKPDVIFTMFPLSLVFYSGRAPLIYRLDTCFLGWQQQYSEFGHLALRLLLWEEHRAFHRCSRIITHSDWNKNLLTTSYGIAPSRIEVFPNPAALPKHSIPASIEIPGKKRLVEPLRLLLVGRDEHRKGIDIGIHIVEQLCRQGVKATLTVCGLAGHRSHPYIQFVGPYKKSDPDQLQQYTDLYQKAHLLLHPARFDPSPLVTSEAAAFGTPTITNAVGGMATSVQDGISGIVLPAHCPPEAYVAAVAGLIHDPDRYYQLCRSTRQRYEQELNWEVAGQKLAYIFRQVVADRQSSGTSAC